MTSPQALPDDHADRMRRVWRCVDGLSVGDALGQTYFFFPEQIASRTLTEPTWHYTDDTTMALSIAAVLERHGRIEQDVLAAAFAREYASDPARGYGGMAHAVLRAIGQGSPWRDAAGGAFGGEGSLGNGGAMRAAPVGAYFADDFGRAAREAALSAAVTHAHSEGQAGAVAIAVAAAAAWNLRGVVVREAGPQLLDAAWDHTPDGATREGIERARGLSRNASVERAVGLLGNGDEITAPDTVPFALWCAARHLDNYEEAFWTTVSGLGDRDTTCAIVGGIVVLSAAPETLPERWRLSRESLGRVRLD